MEDPKENADTFKALYDAMQAVEVAQPRDKTLASDQSPTPAALAALRGWIEKAGGTIHPALHFAPAGDAGIGVMAREPLEADAMLFRVPRACIVSEQTALADTGVAKLSAQLTLFRQFPSALLALFLMLERLRTRRSPWQPYLDVLPRTYSLPLYWTWAELALLRGSPAFGQAHQLCKQAMRLYLVAQQICAQNLKVNRERGREREMNPFREIHQQFSSLLVLRTCRRTRNGVGRCRQCSRDATLSLRPSHSPRAPRCWLSYLAGTCVTTPRAR